MCTKLKLTDPVTYKKSKVTFIKRLTVALLLKNGRYFWFEPHLTTHLLFFPCI